MIIIISERKPRMPKLKKPKELKGIKPAMLYKWGGITTCQAFVEGDNIWINHHDWCSTPANKTRRGRQSFVYNDAFNTPVVKGDAWIKLQGVMTIGKRTDVLRAITQECLIDENSRFCMDDCRMFEDVYLRVWEGTHSGA